MKKPKAKRTLLVNVQWGSFEEQEEKKEHKLTKEQFDEKKKAGIKVLRILFNVCLSAHEKRRYNEGKIRHIQRIKRLKVKK